MFSLKCYSYGSYIGRVVAYRRWFGGRIGPSLFWFVEDATGGWCGSYGSRGDALVAAFAPYPA